VFTAEFVRQGADYVAIEVTMRCTLELATYDAKILASAGVDDILLVGHLSRLIGNVEVQSSGDKIEGHVVSPVFRYGQNVIVGWSVQQQTR
jgi:hypothetical protein